MPVYRLYWVGDDGHYDLAGDIKCAGSAGLRRRARRLREMAREFPKDTSDNLLTLADELDARTASIELPVQPDTPDP